MPDIALADRKIRYLADILETFMAAFGKQDIGVTRLSRDYSDNAVPRQLHNSANSQHLKRLNY